VEAGTSGVRVRSRRRGRSRTLLLQRVAALAIVGTVGGALVGFLFAGSPARIAAGVSVAGVNVGGLTASQATAKLERRASAVAQVPVAFEAAGHTWWLRPGNLGVEADWHAAAKLALQQGDGLGPFRGLRRIGVRVFGADVSPPTGATERSLDYELRRMSRVINAPHSDAAIVLRGLQARVIAGSTGRVLDREAAGNTLVHALAGLHRGGQVDLPVRVDTPSVSAADLQPALLQVRTALSRRVRMNLGAASWWRRAQARHRWPRREALLRTAQ